MANRDSLPSLDRSELDSKIAPTQSRGTPGFDVIIVGGGSAGALMANQLSADPSRRTLFIEAGRSRPPDGYPDPVRRQDLLGG
jgi:choline dehydrogenase